MGAKSQVPMLEKNGVVGFPEIISPRDKLVRGFNPSKKYQSNWKSSPSRGENKKYLKPPPSKWSYNHTSGVKR